MTRSTRNDKSGPCHQLAQDEGQNSAVRVVIDLDGRIDPASDRNGGRRAIGFSDLKSEVLLRLDARTEAEDVESLRSVEGEADGGGAFFELERQDAHADEIGPMDALEA